MVQTIILGLDGANWDLLEPWLSSEKLPNLASLRQEGISAQLESCLPPVTCPNWRCYSTGKNPGKLGVYWWEQINTDTQSYSTPDSRSFESPNYWDYLNENGNRVGIFNLPMTYPPFDVDGFFVSGGPGSEPDQYARPRELERELNNSEYMMHPQDPPTCKEDRENAEEVIDIIDKRFRKFRELINNRPVDVAHCTIFYINALQHFFWRDKVTLRGWEIIDEHIGRIKEEFADSTLILMSDHGCSEVDTVFHINEWLKENGYLVTENRASDVLTETRINKRNISAILRKLRINDLARRVVPDKVKNSMPESEKGFKREQKLARVDWDESSAIASGQGLVYVVEDKDSVVNKLVKELASLTGPDGKPVADQVYTKKEAYHGPYLNQAPDIIFKQRSGVHTSGAVGSSPVFTDTEKWKAENIPSGIFAIYGEDIRTDVDIESISITDVAPTILQSVGNPIPHDMDGEAIKIFKKGEAKFRDPISRSDDDSNVDTGIESRLEDLGYLE